MTYLRHLNKLSISGFMEMELFHLICDGFSAGRIKGAAQYGPVSQLIATRTLGLLRPASH